MLALPLPAPSLRTANRLPARQVLRKHNDLIHIILSALRRVIPTANQIFSLASGRQWDGPVVPEPTFHQPRQRGSHGSACELVHRHRSLPVPIWEELLYACADAMREE